MGEDVCLVEFKEVDRIGYITINNPPVNSLNSRVMSQLSGIVENLEKREDFLVLIITGAGKKAFIAGADINELRNLDKDAGRALSKRGQELFRRLECLPFPVIAAVNGFALGGGFELALACDMRIISEGARIGLPEVKLGIMPGYGGTQRLSRIAGLSAAKKLIFTGDLVDAEDALRMGIVDEVVQGEDLMNRCREIALRILERAPLAVKKAKLAINNTLTDGYEDGFEAEAEYFSQLCLTEDQKEGIESFLNKREPDFQGR